MGRRFSYQPEAGRDSTLNGGVEAGCYTLQEKEKGSVRTAALDQ
jgi:hypothetical protein